MDEIDASGWPFEVELRISAMVDERCGKYHLLRSKGQKARYEAYDRQLREFARLVAPSAIAEIERLRAELLAATK